MALNLPLSQPQDMLDILSKIHGLQTENYKNQLLGAQVPYAASNEAAINALNQLKVPYQQSENQLAQLRIPEQESLNKINEAKAQFEPQSQAAQLALLQAQAKRENALANNPFGAGGPNLKGIAGSIQQLEQVRQMYGEDSPEYKQANELFERKISDPVVRRQAGNAQRLLDEATNIDIGPLQKYTGAGGMAKSLYEKAKMVSGIGEVDPDYRDYAKWQQFTLKQMSDSMRQALNTSVVPEYVKAMVTPLADPTNQAWNDPQQVKAVWNTYTNWLHDYTKSLTQQATSGVPKEVLDTHSFNDYARMKHGQDRAPIPKPNNPSNAPPSEEDIEYTAKKRGISKEEVKRLLGIQ